MLRHAAPPQLLATPRLRLCAWREADADRLLAALLANQDHLSGWIPERVSQPAPPDAMRERIAGYVAAHASWQALRFSVQPVEAEALLGEVDLFFRDANGRVALDAADRAEIGYWLRHDVTGRGYATESAAAVIELARTLPALHRIEIRCDAANAPSAAVPRRLGFQLENSGPGQAGMVWTLGLRS